MAGRRDRVSVHKRGRGRRKLSTGEELLTVEEIEVLIPHLCEQHEMYPPAVRFDLDDIWRADGVTMIEGRYFVVDRLIRFPARRFHSIEPVAHEVAHHLDHDRILMGGDPHDQEHALLTDEVLATARAWLTEEGEAE
jgi:hypothetical protein